MVFPYENENERRDRRRNQADNHNEDRMSKLRRDRREHLPAIVRR